jgi:hypothetical protein
MLYIKYSVIIIKNIRYSSFYSLFGVYKYLCDFYKYLYVLAHCV